MIISDSKKTARKNESVGVKASNYTLKEKKDKTRIWIPFWSCLQSLPCVLVVSLLWVLLANIVPVGCAHVVIYFLHSCSLCHRRERAPFIDSQVYTNRVWSHSVFVQYIYYMFPPVKKVFKQASLRTILNIVPFFITQPYMVL